MLVRTMPEWLVERESMLITGNHSFKLVSYEMSCVPWSLYWREAETGCKNAVGESTLCHSPPVCSVAVLLQHGQ